MTTTLSPATSRPAPSGGRPHRRVLVLFLLSACGAAEGDASLDLGPDLADGFPRDMTSCTTTAVTVGAWASWRMPNPWSASPPLPNRASYSFAVEGVVKDEVTKLEWQRGVASNSSTWAEAKALCANLTLAGGGWRLPSRIEMVSLIDFTRLDPAIDTEAFPDTPRQPSFFWTASPYACGSSEAPSEAWCVEFVRSQTLHVDVNQPVHVRCVR